MKRDGKILLKGYGIKHGGEVLDAEILGVKKALEAALELSERDNGGRDGRQQINVLTDSQSMSEATCRQQSRDKDRDKDQDKNAREEVAILHYA